MVYVLDGSSGELLQTINPNSVYVQFLAWHPTVDGLLAVGQSTNQAMEFWDTQAGELVETQEFISWKWNAADWSPDGKWLAYAGLLPEVAHWQDRQIKHRFEDTDSAPRRPSSVATASGWPSPTTVLKFAITRRAPGSYLRLSLDMLAQYLNSSGGRVENALPRLAPTGRCDFGIPLPEKSSSAMPLGPSHIRFNGVKTATR